MRGSYLIVYKTTQKSSLSNKSTQNQYMKESSIVVTSVTTKHRTSRILGFINNKNTGISSLIVNNVSTKQQKKVIEECTLYRNMKGSDFIVINVSTK